MERISIRIVSVRLLPCEENPCSKPGHVPFRSDDDVGCMLGGEKRYQHCIGDTMLIESLGVALIVVNAGFCVGDT